VALALAAFAAHLRAGLARHCRGAILRIVVVDVDIGRRQDFAKVGHHRGNGRLLVEAWYQDSNPHR
jgi:hypothetical protein